MQHELIEPQEIRGTATRYARSELLRLLAIPLVRNDKTRTLDALKHELDRLGSSELERLVLGSALSPAVAAALGVNQPNPSSVAPGAPENQSWPLARDTSGSLAGVPDSVELWHHVPLLPGLVLLLSSRANVAVRYAAKKIYDDFRA